MLTNWSSPASSGGGSSYPLDPTKNMNYFSDDFLGSPRDGTTAYLFSQFAWATSSQDAGNFSIAGSTIASSINHPGVLQLGSGANSNDASSVFTGTANSTVNPFIFVGSGAIKMRALVNIPALSNGTDNFTLVFGGADAADWSSPSNAIRILYQYATDNTHWILQTNKAGTATTTASSVAVVATGWTWLEIDINAAGTSVSATASGTAIATNTTNIPSIGIPLRCDFRKTLGTTPTFIGIDFVDFQMALSR